MSMIEELITKQRQAAAAAEAARAALTAAYTVEMIEYALKLAAVHLHNLPQIKGIADHYNSITYDVTTVEIGIVAKEKEINFANTDTRDTLGYDKEGYWLELSTNEKRITRKHYLNVVTITEPIRRTAKTDKYAIGVEYEVQGHENNNPVTMPSIGPIYPNIWIPPYMNPQMVIDKIAALDLLLEPEYPPTPEDIYGSDRLKAEKEARSAYIAARNIKPAPPPKTERVKDIDF